MLKKALYWIEQTGMYTVLLIFALVVAIPYLFMVSGSFKINDEIFSPVFNLIPKAPTLRGYQSILGGSTNTLFAREEIPFLRQFGNSVFVSVVTTALVLLTSSLVGWGFSKYQFRGKKFLFLFMIATMTLPFQVTIVPMFLLMNQLGWLNTYLALILPAATSAFGCFLMRQQFLNIPNELLDAARIDGASEFYIYRAVGLPLVKGGLNILGLLQFVGVWNDYLWPSVVLQTVEKFTVPLGLAAMKAHIHTSNYDRMFAGGVVLSIPVLLVLIAGGKSLINNLNMGALKG